VAELPRGGMQRRSAGGSNPTPSADAAPSRKPRETDFHQQKLPSWQPILTPRWLMVTFATIGVVFLILGIVIWIDTNAIVEMRVPYDSTCPAAPPGTQPAPCTVSFSPSSTMVAPVYVYYELTNFYQNHRRYVRSKSDEQLMGKVFQKADTSEIAECAPLITNATGSVLHPCGLIANSFFNDTFFPRAPLTNGWSESGISWKTDRDRKFKNPTPTADDRNKVSFWMENSGITFFGNVPLTVDNEHFIVWMRPAALPQFRKLYAVINTNLAANGNITLDVYSRFPASAYGGTKTLVFSTLGWTGGKNFFLGGAYLIVGGASILASFVACFFLVQGAPNG